MMRAIHLLVLAGVEQIRRVWSNPGGAGEG